MQGYLGWGRTEGAQTRLTDTAGKPITSAAAMTELQNHFYINKVQNIRAQLPGHGDPIALIRQHMQNRPRPCLIGLTPTCVTPEDLENMIIQHKNLKSSGLDNIDTYILKLVRPYIVPSITHIVNLSITTMSFPKADKVAKVVQLY